MREILINESLNIIILIKAIMLNFVYIIISVIFFNRMIEKTKESGKLLNYGE